MKKNKHIWIPVLKRKGASVLLQTYINLGESYEYFRKSLGIKFGFENHIYLDGEIYLELNELKALEAIIKKKMKNPDFLPLMVKKCYSQSKNLLKIAQKTSEIKNLKEKTNKDLEKLFLDYSEEVLKTTPFMNFIVVIAEALQEEISSRIKKILEQRGEEEKLDEYLKTFIFPPKENYPARAVRELIETAALIQKNRDLKRLFRRPSKEILRKLENKHLSLSRKLAEYIEEFGFLTMEYYVGSPMGIEEVIVQLKDLLKEDCVLKLNALKRERRETEKRYESAKRKLKLSRSDLKLIKTAQEVLSLRQYRADALFIAGYLVRNLLLEIAERLDMDYDYLLFLTYKEIRESLRRGKMPKGINLRERKKGFAVFLVDGQFKLVTGRRLAEERAKRKAKITPVVELKGTIAFIGKHTGKARIIETIRDIEKVKDKDVLIAPMTNPYYVPAMIKAGAIVTDEGGILCHAAIVSRELGVPCIIATKHATQVFKDGDLVEVDAERGIVRKLG